MRPHRHSIDRLVPLAAAACLAAAVLAGVAALARADEAKPGETAAPAGLKKTIAIVDFADK